MPPELYARLDALFRADPYAAGLGIELVEWSDGRAVVSREAEDRHRNFVGMGHGAFTFALADVAMSVASNSHGRISPAVRVDINFLRAVQPGTTLVATAQITHATRRLCHLSLDVTADGRDVASATGLTYRTGDWHFGAGAWPDAWRDTH